MANPAAADWWTLSERKSGTRPCSCCASCERRAFWVDLSMINTTSHLPRSWRGPYADGPRYVVRRLAEPWKVHCRKHCRSSKATPGMPIADYVCLRVPVACVLHVANDGLDVTAEGEVVCGVAVELFCRR